MRHYFSFSILRNKIVCFIIILLFSFSMLDMPQAFFGVYEIRVYECLLHHKFQIKKSRKVHWIRQIIHGIKKIALVVFRQRVSCIKTLLRKWHIVFKQVEYLHLLIERLPYLFKGEVWVAYTIVS